MKNINRIIGITLLHAPFVLFYLIIAKFDGLENTTIMVSSVWLTFVVFFLGAYFIEKS